MQSGIPTATTRTELTTHSDRHATRLGIKITPTNPTLACRIAYSQPMHKLRSAAAIALAALAIAGLGAALAPAASAGVHDQAKKVEASSVLLRGPSPEAKKVEAPLAALVDQADVSFLSSFPTVWTAGRIFKDYNKLGGVLQTFTANDGPCDDSGYSFNLYLSSANTQGSSIQMNPAVGSHCNAVKVIAKSGAYWYTRNYGQVINFGSTYNDKSSRVILYHSAAYPNI